MFQTYSLEYKGRLSWVAYKLYRTMEIMAHTHNYTVFLVIDIRICKHLVLEFLNLQGKG